MLAVKLIRPALVIMLLCASAALARADGGSVQFQSAAGPFQVTVFSEPGIIRAGLVDLSVLVQASPHGEPVLDADVTLGLSPLDETRARQQPAWAPPACINDVDREATRITANRSRGPNRLLYSSLVQIPDRGRWQLSIWVHSNSMTGMARTVLEVEPPAPPWVNYWHLFAFPPAAVIGFWLRQRILQRPRRKFDSNEIAP